MPDSFATSPSLIVQARAHNAEAWNQLCYIYTPLVYGWIRRAGLQEADASDLVQDVFSRVLGALGKFEHSSFRGWLLTITRNEIRVWHRRRQSRVPDAVGGSDALSQLLNAPDLLHEESCAEVLDDDPSGTQELVRRAAEMIQGDFEPKTWQAFWRSVVEGHAAADIAQQTWTCSPTPSARPDSESWPVCARRSATMP